jgi:tripartite ATP-independent transporter DctM subunit
MDAPFLTGLIYCFLLFTLLVSNMWIATALGAVGLIGLYFVTGGGAVTMVGELLFNSTNHFTYTMIPLFIFMGELIKHTGISERLYDGASHWVRRIPGGLLHSNIVSCAIFSAVSGSSMATAATIGAVAIPEMERRGYQKRILFGSLAAGGTLGILIPPSLGLIIYGSVVGESIGELFIAGIIPGILTTVCFMLYVCLVAVFKPEMAPRGEKISLSGMIYSLKNVAPVTLLIFMVLGTIYLGVASPTEAAALGAAMAFILALLYRRLNWTNMTSSLSSALQTSCYIMLIVVSAYVLSMAFSMERIPAELTSAVTSLNINRYAIWALLVLVYIVIGAFIDGISILLLTVPVVHPMMTALGFDSIWLGIVLTICIEMGQITPPVGVNLFVIHGISGRKHFKDVILGSLPFFFIQILVVAILTIFPVLVTWLPSMMITRY